MPNGHGQRDHAEVVPAADAGAPPPTPPDRTGRVVGHVLSGVLCALVVLTLVVNAVTAWLVVPMVTEGFHAHNAPIPTLTRILIDFRSLIVVLSLCLAVLMILKEVFIRQPVPKLVVNAIVLIATLILVPLTVLALFLPLVKLMQSVQ